MKWKVNITICILILFIIYFISLIMACETNNEFVLNTNITICTGNCIYRNESNLSQWITCDSSVSCKFTAFYPNESLLLAYGDMVRDNNKFNYSLGNLTTTGTYRGKFSCYRNKGWFEKEFIFIINSGSSGSSGTSGGSGGSSREIQPQISLKIKIHYYLKDSEVFLYKYKDYDSVSFDIIATNLNELKLKNLKIYNINPSNFINYFPNETNEISAYEEDKILWQSTFIPTSYLNSSFIFNISIIGNDAFNRGIYSETSSKIDIEFLKKNLLKNLGYKIHPGNYKIGLMIFIVFIVIILIIFKWKYFKDKFYKKWKKQNDVLPYQ